MTAALVTALKQARAVMDIQHACLALHAEIVQVAAFRTADPTLGAKVKDMWASVQKAYAAALPVIDAALTETDEERAGQGGMR